MNLSSRAALLALAAAAAVGASAAPAAAGGIGAIGLPAHDTYCANVGQQAQADRTQEGAAPLGANLVQTPLLIQRNRCANTDYGTGLGGPLGA
ncbi:hypothetical protein [Streptomyces bicolor]|uniref:hypothetical protein n=1 Tax=Streptomyces bicolor TaxID=66874 RepID=UPI0004E24731|nr:hypothetical protein [Streptomyces bicolor]